MQFLVCVIAPEGGAIITEEQTEILRKDRPEFFFTSEKMACKIAEALAYKNPGVQYGVFGVLKIVETSKPNIIYKKIDATGQLVMETQK